jgi:hypothetical protein
MQAGQEKNVFIYFGIEESVVGYVSVQNMKSETI